MRTRPPPFLDLYNSEASSADNERFTRSTKRPSLSSIMAFTAFSTVSFFDEKLSEKRYDRVVSTKQLKMGTSCGAFSNTSKHTWARFRPSRNASSPVSLNTVSPTLCCRHSSSCYRSRTTPSHVSCSFCVTVHHLFRQTSQIETATFIRLIRIEKTAFRAVDLATHELRKTTLLVTTMTIRAGRQPLHGRKIGSPKCHTILSLRLTRNIVKPVFTHESAFQDTFSSFRLDPYLRSDTTHPVKVRVKEKPPTHTVNYCIIDIFDMI